MNNKSKAFRKIYKKIKEYETIVIGRHIGPDPDAVGSQLGLRDSIRLTFPNKKVYAVGASVAKFKHLGTLDKIDEEEVKDALLIVVDLPNLSRLDGANKEKYKEILKIDHHPYEQTMGKYDYIDETASSASEIVLDLINSSKLMMNEIVASQLFTGVVADSDRFLLPTTSSHTFELMSEIIDRYKLDLKTLYNNLYERPLNEVKFQSFITLNMIVTENGFGYIKLTEEEIKEFKVDSSAASNMVNNFNFIKGIYAWAFSSYDNNTKQFKINIRSRGPIINDVASNYNGGGHKFASGARILEEENVDKLFNDLDQRCKEYKENLTK